MARLIDAKQMELQIKEALKNNPVLMGQMLRWVRLQPTVDAVEVVHGRWVMKETMIRSPFAKNAYCSVCLEETSYAHNYCPNCGAKMDGDGNG